MKILTSSQIKEADKYTIENEPINSVDLMERAAQQCTGWISNRFDRNEPLVFFAGPGNNGGDAWAIARQLAEKGYSHITFYLFDITGKLSPDAQINRERLEKQGKVSIHVIKGENDFPVLSEPDVVIDGLFGSGLSRPLEGLSAILVNYINSSARKSIVAIDIPSGLFGEESVTDNSRAIIHADFTLTFQFPKLSFFFPENDVYVGKWNVLPIGLHQDFIKNVDTPYNYVTEEEIRSILHTRRKFSHKGTYGHGLLMAGAYGMMGAAVLAARAAKKSGIGLVTAHIPRLGYDIIQTAVPEALTSIDLSEVMITQHPLLENYTAVAMGPGTGQDPNTQKALETVLDDYEGPLVLDADALNIISQHEDLLRKLPQNTLLTPHPKEFDRLFGTSVSGYERVQKQIQFSKEFKCFIILKGANTSISDPEGRVCFNTTGNPGMATGGSGDVLTGILLSLLAQKYPAQSAGKTGVYIHGLAGDIAASNESMEAVTATDIIDSIGLAFKKIKNE